MPRTVTPSKAGKAVTNAAKKTVAATKKVVNKAIENKRTYDKRVDDMLEADRKKLQKDRELSKGKIDPVTLGYKTCSKSAKGLAMDRANKIQAEIDAVKKR
ncbi:MAG: hypothetical protein FWD40_00790 [Treponema sp.]|nr:hypothetical protein [Treponema sp.]